MCMLSVCVCALVLCRVCDVLVCEQKIEAAEDEPTRLHNIKELRQSVLYLSLPRSVLNTTARKHAHHTRSSTSEGWSLKKEKSGKGVDVWHMDKVFTNPSAGVLLAFACVVYCGVACVCV